MKTKIWDGIHINTVSVDDVEYMVCEHWEGTVDKNNNYIPPRSFKLKPEVTQVDIKMKLHGIKKKFVIKKVHIKQFGVLVNIATTGHKLQGMSKDNIIVVNWFYSVKNWVYVVLSRVRTLNGLYLFKPLDPKKYFKEDNKLTNHMNDLKALESKTLNSVKDVPKTSLELKMKSTFKSSSDTNGKLSKSNREKENVKRKLTQSSEASKSRSKMKPKKQPTSEENLVRNRIVPL